MHVYHLIFLKFTFNFDSRYHRVNEKIGEIERMHEEVV